ncbi:MAG: hypothetical protein ABJO52_20870 [Nisaea sp.]|uniref:hypothetical protein n=1 Tax=Nisaea sp. TaxID=2024842 RepID=UPI003298F9A3
MSQSYEHETGQMLRHACTNVIGFWQLLNCERTISGKRICPIKRMEWRAYLTTCAVKLAGLVLEHKETIAEGFLEDPSRIREFEGTSYVIRLNLRVADELDLDAFDERAGQFAIALLGALKRG